jgi:hypothetical protein
MNGFQDLLERSFADLPRKILRQFFGEKLRLVGVEATTQLLDRLVSHIEYSKEDVFHWDDGADSIIHISISERDIEEIERRVQLVLDRTPDIVSDLADKLAPELLSSFRTKFAAERLSLEYDQRNDFKNDLWASWGRAFELLRLFLSLSTEFGQSVAQARQSSAKNVDIVLTRLHARACQVTTEILTLLESGLADGAMARWRTLHEIAIVTVLMSVHGEPLAERYLEHRYVEAKVAKDQYKWCGEMLGYEPLNEGEIRSIEEEYERVIRNYGKTFRAQYGWAEGFVRPGSRGSIGLGELEAAAGRQAFASHYKLASQNVHASPNSIFFRLGLLTDSDLLAGASAHGLVEPAQHTVLILGLITTLQMHEVATLDNLLFCKSLQLLVSEVLDAIARAETGDIVVTRTIRKVTKRRRGLQRRVRVLRQK